MTAMMPTAACICVLEGRYNYILAAHIYIKSSPPSHPVSSSVLRNLRSNKVDCSLFFFLLLPAPLFLAHTRALLPLSRAEGSESGVRAGSRKKPTRGESVSKRTYIIGRNSLRMGTKKGLNHVSFILTGGWVSVIDTRLRPWVYLFYFCRFLMPLRAERISLPLREQHRTYS